MSQWTPIVGLKEYAWILARRMGFIALGWILLYFASQGFRGDGNVLILFAPLIGGAGGLVAGWYIATNSVEDSGMSGLLLWTILVAASLLAIWGADALLYFIFHKWLHLTRDQGFGWWMLMTAATLMDLAAAVWHSTSQQ